MKKSIIAFLTLSLVTTHLAFGTLTKKDSQQKRRDKDYNKAILLEIYAKKGHTNNKKVRGTRNRCKQLQSQIIETDRNIYEEIFGTMYEQYYNEDS